MNELPIVLEDCHDFIGGWSLDPNLVYAALKHTDFDRPLRVLEFGAGDSTPKLLALLKKLTVGCSLRYVSYETLPEYACQDPAVETVLYFEFPEQLVEGIFDLVIIDGPHGEGRAHWYRVLRDRVRYGTILAIDDVDHFPSFREQLETYFRFDTLAYHGTGVSPTPGNNWLVVRIRGVKRPSGVVI